MSHTLNGPVKIYSFGGEGGEEEEDTLAGGGGR